MNAGLLRLSSTNALPGGTGVSGGTSALTLSGGVLELAAGDFERNLGTGSSQFQITGGTSGFSAKGAHRCVNVNGDSTQELVWGSGSFNPSALVLNSDSAVSAGDRCDNNLTLANKIDLNGATRTVEVNSYAAILPSVIQTSSSTAGLTKTGNGMLVLSGANTYNGTTTITAGLLSMGAANNAGAGSSAITFNGGGLQIRGTSLTSLSGIGHTVTFTSGKTVSFDIEDAANTFTVNQTLNQGTGGLRKLGNGTLIVTNACTFSGGTTNSGGTLVLDYSSADSSKLSDSNPLGLGGGTLELRGGTHSEEVQQLNFDGEFANFITRSSGSATINVNVIGRSGGRRCSLSFSEAGIATTDTANMTSGDLGGWVTVGSHLAINSTGGADGSITNYSAYTPFVTSGGAIGVNYQLQGSSALDAAESMGTLRIENTADDDVLDLKTFKLTIENYNQAYPTPSGVILYAGGANNNYTITGTSGSLSPKNGSGQVLGINTYTGTLTLDATLGFTSSDLVKTGAGTLVMQRASSSYSGNTYLQQGVTRMSDSSALGTTGGISIQSGAALELTNNITVGAKALTIAGTGISNGGALRNVSGNNTYGGAISVFGSSARINSDSGTLTLTGNITTLSDTATLGSRSESITFGGAGDIIVSNATVQALGITKDGAGTLGIVVDDSSSTQWTCSSMTLNDSTLALTFNVAPSETEPVIKIIGDLTFSGTPTIEIVIDEEDITSGTRYPLLEVVGDAPSTSPTLVVSTGVLRWSGDGNGTLYWDTTVAGGTLFLFE